MTTSPTAFPLSGVIGIIDSTPQQLELAVASGLRCVEVRADLLRTAGLSDSALLDLVSLAKTKGLACLFTLRHADQGGTFNSAESERVSLCKQALDAGADILDLEHGTEASRVMLQASAPMILSYHNFQAMVTAEELASLTHAMEQQAPAAIKIIPTGSSLADAATMLSWVGAANNGVRRIGFSMGEAGGVSRILTLVHGAPVTYASFGKPVAPGQVDIDLLLKRYHCNQMTENTPVIALIGSQDQVDQYVASKGSLADASNANKVFVSFDSSEREAVERYRAAMNVSHIQVL